MSAPCPRAERDAALAARVIRRLPLRYARGADATLDRPAHVRASSALCRVGDALVVLQDDAAFLGLVDADTGLVSDLPLPAGPGGRRVFDAARGNKADKPDFELAFELGGRVLAMGSGGLPARQGALTWRPPAAPRGLEIPAAPKLRSLPRLYRALAELAAGAGTLNLEGGARLGDRVYLANRGGDRFGALPAQVTADVLLALDAAALLALCADPTSGPLPQIVGHEVELGELGDGARLRFTDLSPRGDGSLWYLAAAERTTSFYDDGEVAGSALGVIELASGGGPRRLRYAPIFDERGELAGDKVEGVCAGAAPDRLWAVTDPDDATRPGELLELSLRGPW